MHDALFGGIAIDETGDPYPLEKENFVKTMQFFWEQSAVRNGVIPKQTRPEKGLLDMRSDLGVYANLRQIKTYPQLIDNSPIENAKLKDIDILFVRELIGGIYFGDKEKTDDYAKDVCEYSASE